MLVAYSLLYKINGIIITIVNAIRVVIVNNSLLTTTSFISGGTNMKHIPRMLASSPVPATDHRPMVPPGILKDRSWFGLVIRKTITERNMSAYITK
jgi:hypothetical protein